MEDKAATCAINNAEWCDNVCRAHGMPGKFAADIWTQPSSGPLYYPNAVTLSRSGLDQQYAAIRTLGTTRLDGFAVKDSFGVLDLGESGFHRLFDAQWVWLDPTLAPCSATDGLSWLKVSTETDLERWEAAWTAAGSPTPTRVFLPSLLYEDAIAFLAAVHDGQIIAGCIASRSRGGVVGFSNFFAPASDRDRFRIAALAKVSQLCPGWPLVGYDRDEELAGLLASGFRSVGHLRIWMSD